MNEIVKSLPQHHSRKQMEVPSFRVGIVIGLEENLDAENFVEVIDGLISNDLRASWEANSRARDEFHFMAFHHLDETRESQGEDEVSGVADKFLDLKEERIQIGRISFLFVNERLYDSWKLSNWIDKGKCAESRPRGDYEEIGDITEDEHVFNDVLRPSFLFRRR